VFIGAYNVIPPLLGIENHLVVVFLAGLPLLLTFLTRTLPAIREKRRERRLEQQGRNPTTITPDYFRLTAYEALDATRFQRADGFHQRVARWLGGDCPPLCYLSGRSGCGKSSLLGAHVMPELEAQGKTVCRLRVHGEPLAELTSLLSTRLWERAPTWENARDLLERSVKKCNRGLVLVWDQFEESLILHEREQVAVLFALLKDLGARPIPGLTNLLVLRSDYQGMLMDHGFPALLQEQNWLEVPPFNPAAARTFLMDAQLGLSHEQVIALVKEAEELDGTEGAIRPVTLNMLGMALRRQHQAGTQVGNLMRHWLRGLLRDPDIRELAPKLLAAMITRHGTKQPRKVVDLASQFKLPNDRVLGCLLRLQTQGLVQPLDNELQIWEIAHDFLARLLDRILAGWRATTWRVLRPWLAPAVFVVWAIWLGTFGFDYLRPAREVLDAHGASFAKDELVLFTGTTDASLRRVAPHLARYGVTNLAFDRCNAHSFEPLLACQKLEHLKISNSPADSLDGFPKLDNLISLDLFSCDRLTSLTGMPEFDQLTSLNIYFCDGLTSLTEMPELDQLTYLNLPGCNGLTSLAGMPELDQLTSLDLSSCGGLMSLVGMPELDQLTYLNLSGCDGLTSLAGMPEPDKLTLLRRLSCNTSSVDADFLKKHRQIQELNLFRGNREEAEALKRLRPEITIRHTQEYSFDLKEVTLPALE